MDIDSGAQAPVESDAKSANTMDGPSPGFGKFIQGIESMLADKEFQEARPRYGAAQDVIGAIKSTAQMLAYLPINAAIEELQKVAECTCGRSTCARDIGVLDVTIAVTTMKFVERINAYMSKQDTVEKELEAIASLNEAQASTVGGDPVAGGVAAADKPTPSDWADAPDSS